VRRRKVLERGNLLRREVFPLSKPHPFGEPSKRIAFRFSDAILFEILCWGVCFSKKILTKSPSKSSKILSKYLQSLFGFDIINKKVGGGVEFEDL
jgi:DNA-binding HxlR family transcriptional regulator